MSKNEYSFYSSFQFSLETSLNVFLMLQENRKTDNLLNQCCPAGDSCHFFDHPNIRPFLLLGDSRLPVVLRGTNGLLPTVEAERKRASLSAPVARVLHLTHWAF